MLNRKKINADFCVVGGGVAGICAEFNLAPHGVYLEKTELLQDMLMDDDCFIPNKKRKAGELCRKTPVQGGNESLKNGEDRPHKIYNSSECGMTVKNGTALEYRFEKFEPVKSVHITFDSDLNRTTLPGDECERTKSTRCNTLLNSPQFYVPKTLCKEFLLTAEAEEGQIVLFEKRNNLCRAFTVPVNRKLKGIKLTPISNHGESETTAVFSFDFR